MTDKAFDGRIALVTGASRGIGRALALGLAREGAHVIATARTQGGLEELDDAIRAEGGSATLVPMDLMAPDGIEKLADAVRERWGRLDMLAACAGALGVLTPAAQVSAKVWNQVLAVNTLAPARLIRAFESLLAESGAGRAVFLTSSGNRRAYWAPYAASKAALEALVECWAAEIAQSPIRVNLYNPGHTRTAMRAKAMPGEDPESVKPPEATIPGLLALLSADCALHGQTVSYED